MADLTGQTLGKYQILDRLGRGGMADVYKGYQPGLDRYVAVKVMHAHLAEDADFITRFKREAKSVAELRHPNIVQVFDFDVQGEIYYMVMEYIAGGETLKQRMQALSAQHQRLPIEQTLDIMIKLSDALAYAHDKGMIHRDIKPANVLVPSLDRPVLSDFGIARLLGETGLTASGAMIGTPAYMSPEQGRGEHGDARSDIYSLGIVFYEMLTGKPPYDADTPFAIILKHINDPLVPPHTLIDPMPEAIERIVLKCLAKEPGDRFASMADLRDALRDAQSSIGREKATSTIAAAAATAVPIKPPLETVPAAPIEPIAPAAAVSRSGGLKPAWLIGGAVAVGLIGIILVIFLASRGNTPTAGVEPTRAPLTSAVVETTPQPANTPVIAEAATPVANAQALIDQSYRQLYAGDTDAARETIAQALKLAPENPQARVARAMIEIYAGADYKLAAADLEATATVMSNDPFYHLAAGALHRRSEEHYDAAAAEQELTQAVETCGDNAPLCSVAYEERGKTRAWDSDNYEGALQDFEHAAKLSTIPYQQADLYSYEADLYFKVLGDLAKGIELARQAYQLNKWPGYLEYAAKYAVLAGEYDQALDVYNQLLKDENGDPRLLAGRAYVELRAADPDTALESAERALQLQPDLLEARYVKALALLNNGESEKALAEFQALQALAEKDPDAFSAISEPFLNKDFGHELYFHLAQAAYDVDDLDAALDYLAHSITNDEWWAYPYALRGVILAQQGDLPGAREAYLKALDLAGDDEDLRNTLQEELSALTQ